jgi:hypothetical protein
MDIHSSDVLHIKATDDTPEILIDPDKGLIKLSGRSLPEDPKEFFNPIKERLSNYAENPTEGTKVIFKFEYFNTASSKVIMEIIDIVKKISLKDESVVFEWHYLEDDDDMREAGDDYADIAEIEFSFFTYED